MSDAKIHVIPLGEDWDVEDEAGASLLHESSREEAVRKAKELALRDGIASILVHDGDGVTEEVSVEKID